MEAAILALGGIVGSALKAWVTTDQMNVSKNTVADVLIGGAVGLIYPLYPVIDFPAAATLVQKAAIIGMIAYFSSDLITNVAARFGVGKK